MFVLNSLVNGIVLFLTDVFEALRLSIYIPPHIIIIPPYDNLSLPFETWVGKGKQKKKKLNKLK